MFRPTPTRTRSEHRYVPASGAVLAAILAWKEAQRLAEGKDYWSREVSDVGWAWRAIELEIIKNPQVWHRHDGWVYGVKKWSGCRGLELKRYEDKYR